MKTFSNIRFKTKTARRFQEFSRRFFKTHTEAMDGMLDFFFLNEISPHEKLGPRMTLIMEFLQHLKQYLGKRHNANIAVTKEMEKQGIMPTKAMIQLLFEHSPQKKRQPLLVEKRTRSSSPKEDAFFKSAMESIELQKENTDLKRSLKKSQMELKALVAKIQIVKSSFGRNRLQLNMTLNDFQSLQSKFKNP